MLFADFCQSAFKSQDCVNDWFNKTIQSLPAAAKTNRDPGGQDWHDLDDPILAVLDTLRIDGVHRGIHQPRCHHTYGASHTGDLREERRRMESNCVCHQT